MVDHGAMRAYSEDLRQKVVQAVEQRGTSKSEAARQFGISLSSVKRYTKLASRGESLTPRKGSGRPPKADDATRKLLEEDYVERILAPTLRRDRVVVMDNLSAHKGERVKELIEGRGCELMYLPSYSPDYNPIEEAFSKIKNLIRKAEARSREALLEAIGAAISVLSARDARGFFEHCGYRAAVQPF
jgi:transposase